jgi:hypothetical protein
MRDPASDLAAPGGTPRLAPYERIGLTRCLGIRIGFRLIPCALALGDFARQETVATRVTAVRIVSCETYEAFPPSAGTRTINVEITIAAGTNVPCRSTTWVEELASLFGGHVVVFRHPATLQEATG